MYVLLLLCLICWQEHENRFWTTVAFCFSGALVFVHDSPVALGQWSPVLGFLFVMMFTFSVHSYDRQAKYSLTWTLVCGV